MTNISLSVKIIDCLLESGIDEFCLCAGARNSPLIAIFDENPNLKTYHFFDERAASFFALGRIAATRKPVAVITTSGTAAAECLSAAVEGTYSSLPLIIITADRPRTYRGTGAPQTINQIGLYSYYIEATFDLDEINSHVSLSGLSWKKPVHINVCFTEPLLDAPVPKINIPQKVQRTRFPEYFPIDMGEKLEQFLETHRPLVIASTIPVKVQKPVFEFLKVLNAPIYAEAISGLREYSELEPLLIRSSDKMLEKLISNGLCDSVIRIGGIPTTRFWRDLEEKFSNLPVLSIGYNHFTGLSRDVDHYDDLEDLPRLGIPTQKSYDKSWKDLDSTKQNQIQELLIKYPLSEPAQLQQISKFTNLQSVYIGNSLPIREWDLVLDPKTKPLRTAASRGANGIDGQISTFMGWSKSKTTNFCIIGDLTALYDLNALWIAPQLKDQKHVIFILNNHGGMIFNRMFGKEIFLNRHQIEFSNWAKMWNWDYQSWNEIPTSFEFKDHQIIEVCVNEEQTNSFWKDYNNLWN